MNLRQGRKEAVTVLDGTKYGNLQLRSREAGMSRPNLVRKKYNSFVNLQPIIFIP